jgi:hypothetical protein
MNKTPAHCPEDQRIIDKLRKQVGDLNRKLENHRKEFVEYRVRHPENVGVKNGKPYEIQVRTEAGSGQRSPEHCIQETQCHDWT